MNTSSTKEVENLQSVLLNPEVVSNNLFVKILAASMSKNEITSILKREAVNDHQNYINASLAAVYKFLEETTTDYLKSKSNTNELKEMMLAFFSRGGSNGNVLFTSKAIDDVIRNQQRINLFLPIADRVISLDRSIISYEIIHSCLRSSLLESELKYNEFINEFIDNTDVFSFEVIERIIYLIIDLYKSTYVQKNSSDNDYYPISEISTYAFLKLIDKCINNLLSDENSNDQYQKTRQFIKEKADKENRTIDAKTALSKTFDFALLNHKVKSTVYIYASLVLEEKAAELHQWYLSDALKNEFKKYDFSIFKFLNGKFVNAKW